MDANLDIIGFDACLMGMVETAYALRGVASVMVASEDLEPGSGWQYDDWLPKLVDNPSISPSDLGKVLVSSYMRTYDVDGPRDDTTTTLSAVSLNDMEKIAGYITLLSKALTTELDTNAQGIRAARLACKVYAPHPFPNDPRDYFQHVDFVEFCNALLNRSELSEIHEEILAAKTAILNSVLASYAGTARRGGYGSHGLAIYFPVSGHIYRSDPFEEGGYKKDNLFYPVEFVQKHGWADFLHKYFEVAP